MPKPSTFQRMIADEHELFIAHNRAVFLAVLLVSFPMFLLPVQVGYYSAALSSAVLIYYLFVTGAVAPSYEWWQRIGQEKLAEVAKKTWLDTPENRRLAIGLGVVMTFGLWVQAAREIFCF